MQASAAAGGSISLAATLCAFCQTRRARPGYSGCCRSCSDSHGVRHGHHCDATFNQENTHVATAESQVMEEDRQIQAAIGASMRGSLEPVQDHPFAYGANLWEHVNKVCCTQTYRDRQEFAESTEAFMQVFRVCVPAAHIGQSAGPDGLNLRAQYGMHAVAIERGEPKMVHLDVDASTVFENGDYMWFALGGKVEKERIVVEASNSVSGKIVGSPEVEKDDSVADLRRKLTSIESATVDSLTLLNSNGAVLEDCDTILKVNSKPMWASVNVTTPVTAQRVLTIVVKGMGDIPHLVPKEVPKHAQDGLQRFLLCDDLSQVQTGHMPVIKWQIPREWVSSSPLHLKLRADFGITLSGVMSKHGVAMWFPEPTSIFREGDCVFMNWASSKKYMQHGFQTLPTR